MTQLQFYRTWALVLIGAALTAGVFTTAVIQLVQAARRPSVSEWHDPYTSPGNIPPKTSRY